MVIKKDKTKKIVASKSVKTLGAHINSSLIWKDEHEHVKVKMANSIKTLMKTEMEIHQARLCLTHICCQMCFFGCGIVQFTKLQTDELRKMCELLMIRKVGLGDNFPQKLLHVRKLALGAGLIEPSIAIDMLALKTHVGDKRNEGTLSEAIKMHEELSANNSGLNKIERRKLEESACWKQ